MLLKSFLLSRASCARHLCNKNSTLTQ
jgi:hypothetical protein